MQTKNKKYLIVVVGPTAIGKTTIAIKIANFFNTEIISADSRQFYKEMSIGTAKPTQEEQSLAPHYFIDCISIQERYSAGQFEIDAIEKIQELFKKHNSVVVVGGSGLYIDAITKGFDDIPFDLNIRKKLNKQLKTNGLEDLRKELKNLDPDYYNNSNTLNPQRVIRALEVCLTTGKTYSSFRKKQPKIRPFEIITIGLTDEREEIYNRINKRVDLMIMEGLIDEAKFLYPFRKLNALNTVGYKELFDYFDNQISREDAIEKIKKNTRNFAKRQLTWFRKNSNTHWFKKGNIEQIIPFLTERMK